MAIKKGSSDKFYQDMQCLAYRGEFPLKAMFELTYKCNFRCLHCYVVADKSKKELTTEEVKLVLDQLKAAGDEDQRTLTLVTKYAKLFQFNGGI